MPLSPARRPAPRRLRTFERAALATLLVALASLAPSVARADEKEACVAATEQAQTLRDEGKLRAARVQILACARDACPPVIRRDCEKWLAEVDVALPTVVLGARDTKGNDVVSARVLLDGSPFASKLDGRPLPVDPGEHTFRYEAPPFAPIEQHAVIRVGEKNRMLTAILAPGVTPPPLVVVAPPVPAPAQPSDPAPAPAEATSDSGGPGPPVAAWIFTGVGVAALGSFAYFGLTGRGDVNDLRSTCAPNCAQSDVDAAHTKLIVADVSLGVGVASLAVATWLFLRHGSASAVHADVQPRPGGGVATISARF